MNKVTITLTRERMCKNSVVYKPSKSVQFPALTGLYLMNTAYVELSKPETITVSIESSMVHKETS